MVDSARGSRVGVYAQTMHEADSGAFTGEVSAPMLIELDVDGVVLGHSERRQYCNETDKALQQKVPKALEAGLVPILCVGETEEERERGDTERKLRHQVQEGLDKVPIERLPEVVIAYEPVWAIGTGLTATSEQAQDACRASCARSSRASTRPPARPCAILYGGSLKPDNAEELLALPDVDGGADRRREPRRRATSPRSCRPRRGWSPRHDASPASASSCSTAGGWRRTGRATRSRWRTRRCSTASGTSTRTRR